MLRIVCVLGLASIGSSAFAAEYPGDRAIKARAILKAHCAECHDAKAGSPSSLQLLDFAQLVDSKRTLPPFVKPKAPAASQVVQFIEDGSMPPGDKPKLTPDQVATVKEWIEQGAIAFPLRFDDSFAYAAILADQEKMAPPERKNFRYLTLNHLLEASPLVVELANQRDALRLAINGVSKKELEALHPIDPTETIFQVDLRETGWGGAPFRTLDRDNKNLPSLFNLFDTILLEYPFGEMPPFSKVTERLAEIWLRPIEQVRPIAFVRADWFTKALADTRLQLDLKRLLSVGAKGRGPMTAPDNGPKSPADVLLHLPARPLPAGIPITPIDAWYAKDIEVKNGPNLSVVLNNAAGKPNKIFKPGERLKMDVKCDEDVFIEMIQVDAEGVVRVHDLGAKMLVKANVATSIRFDGKDDGLLIGDVVGAQRLIVFAAKQPIPAGDILEFDQVDPPIDRFVHRIYRLPRVLGDPPPDFDPSKMVRRVELFEVAK